MPRFLIITIHNASPYQFFLVLFQPPPLHEVWLDEAGLRHVNKDHIQQRHWNEDLMRDHNGAVI